MSGCVSMLQLWTLNPHTEGQRCVMCFLQHGGCRSGVLWHHDAWTPEGQASLLHLLSPPAHLPTHHRVALVLGGREWELEPVRFTGEFSTIAKWRQPDRLTSAHVIIQMIVSLWFVNVKFRVPARGDKVDNWRESQNMPSVVFRYFIRGTGLNWERNRNT